MTSRRLIPTQPEAGAEWRQAAACRDEDPELFFPLPTHKAGIDDAKAVCFSCRVREECLEEGLRGHNRYGVWGGLSEDEREPLLFARTRGVS